MVIGILIIRVMLELNEVLRNALLRETHTVLGNATSVSSSTGGLRINLTLFRCHDTLTLSQN